MQHTTYNVRVIRKQRTSDTSVDITFERLLRNAICLQNLRGTLQYETLNIMVKQTAYSIEPTYNIKYTIYSIHHTAYIIQHKAYRVQHIPYSIQYTTYGIQCTASSIQHATYSLQCSSDTHTAYEWYECGYYFWETLMCCKFEVSDLRIIPTGTKRLMKKFTTYLLFIVAFAAMLSSNARGPAVFA